MILWIWKGEEKKYSEAGKIWPPWGLKTELRANVLHSPLLVIEHCETRTSWYTRGLEASFRKTRDSQGASKRYPILFWNAVTILLESLMWGFSRDIESPVGLTEHEAIKKENHHPSTMNNNLHDAGSRCLSCRGRERKGISFNYPTVTQSPMPELSPEF